ncbi:MAG: hypothetical protein J0M17_09980 [Planctomycetes bacterium]|nr:hypothetical protein [Planctomycetota bacterium]
MHQFRTSLDELAAPRPKRLTLVQVCPSLHRACGVGNFARNCAAALADYGVDVTTATDFPEDLDADLLIQHEYALFDGVYLKTRLAQQRGRVFLFAHSPHADRGLGAYVDGFLTLCRGMTADAARTLVLPHPGWQRLPLENRAELKAAYGWSHFRCVLGTNGFMSPSRQFDEVARRLLPFAARENILVHVIGTRHHSHDDRPGYRDQERRLQDLAAAYPQALALKTRFLDQEELNRRLQACDLTWCWTATPSVPYGSGTCADQYGSGTRLVVARKLQHEHVLGLPNVVAAPADLEGFVEVVKREAATGGFARHDPSPLSWRCFAEQVVRFLDHCPRRLTRLPETASVPVVAPVAPVAPLHEALLPERSLTLLTAAAAAERFLATIEPYPQGFQGRGIVTCAGGPRYLACAWVLIRTLRRLGCRLPIEVWCYRREVDLCWSSLASSYGVTVRVCEEEPAPQNPRWAGWRLKPTAILNSAFHEVLYLDADNVPLRDPAELFDSAEYQAQRTVFWPDQNKSQSGSDQWTAFGVPSREEYEVESGQLLIDKSAAWPALKLCEWFNRHAEFFYRFVYGDKDTFRFAWRRTGTPYAMPPQPVVVRARYLLQHDFQGIPLFQHRHGDKWSLTGSRRLAGFVGEAEALADLAELRRLWRPGGPARERSAADQRLFAALAEQSFRLVRTGRAAWEVTLGPAGTLTCGWTNEFVAWDVRDGELWFGPSLDDLRYRLSQASDGVWTATGGPSGARGLRLIPSSPGRPS